MGKRNARKPRNILAIRKILGWGRIISDIKKPACGRLFYVFKILIYNKLFLILNVIPPFFPPCTLCVISKGGTAVPRSPSGYLDCSDWGEVLRVFAVKRCDAFASCGCVIIRLWIQPVDATALSWLKQSATAAWVGVDFEVHEWILDRIDERDLTEGSAIRPTDHLSMAS